MSSYSVLLLRKIIKYILLSFASLLILLASLIGFAVLNEGEPDFEKLCQTEIEQGEYSQFTDAMSRCMEDMWKASAGAEIAILFAIPILLIGLIIFWIGWRIKLK